MPRINEMIESKFLKKEDVDNDGRGALLTILSVKQYNVAMEGKKEQFKWCMLFQEIDKPMVLNVTNMKLIESITGSDDTDAWIGHKIVAYNDPTISYAGEITGGIRVRAPRTALVNPSAAPAKLAPPQEDPLPF